MAYDPRQRTADALARRPRRRWARWALAAFTLFVLADAVVLTFAPSDDPVVALMVPFWLLFLTVILSPFGRESWTTARGRAVYDEFETAQLAAATTRAYAMFLVLCAMLGLWAWNGRHGEVLPALSAATWLQWLVSLLTIGVTLPVVIAEWTVPMPEPDEPVGDKR